MKICPVCKTEKSDREFSQNIKTKDKLMWNCKACAANKSNEWYANNRERRAYTIRIARLKSRYNLTEEDYNMMLDNQSGVCAICFQPPEEKKRFDVDHDHSCCPNGYSCGKCVRGLLHAKCNGALGWFEKNQNQILKYLKKEEKCFLDWLPSRIVDDQSL